MKGINLLMCIALSVVLIILASCEQNELHSQSEDTHPSRLFASTIGKMAWIQFTPPPPGFNLNQNSEWQPPTTTHLYGQIVAVDNGWLWLREHNELTTGQLASSGQHLIAISAIMDIRLD